MKLENILGLISAIDEISIQDSTGVLFNGLCQDFRATCNKAYDLLNVEVDGIRSFKNVTIIFLNE